MNPSPFEIAQSTGNQFARGFRGARESSALDQALQQVMNSETPEQASGLIGKILNNVRDPNKQQLALSIINNKISEMRGQQTRDADVAGGLDPRLAFASPDVRRANLSKDKENKSALTDNGDSQLALQRLTRMKELRTKGNLGFSPLASVGAGRLSSKETQRDRGEYEQLGKSLISFATNIPIRNRIEFETLAEKLYDPSLSDGEAEGVIAALEQIISKGEGIQETDIQRQSAPQEGSRRVNKKTNQTAIYRGGQWILE